MAGQKKECMHLLQEKASVGYLIAMLLVFPLVYHNNYIDIIQTKKYFFLTATLIYAIVCLAGIFAEHKKLRKRREDKKVFQSKPARTGSLVWNSMDFSVGIFAMGLLISALLSSNWADALWGIDGRRLGVVVMAAGILAYAMLSHYARISQTALRSYLLGSGIVFVLSICSTFQIDVLQMKANLAPEEHYFFVGTIGNLNVAGGFAALMVSVGMALSYYAKERFSERVYGIYLFLGFSAMLCCRCDTAVLCAAAAFLVVYWPALVSEEGIKKAQRMFLLWIAASASLACMRIFFAQHTYTFDGISLLAVSWEAIVGELLLWSVLQWYAWRIGKLRKESRGYIRNVLYGITAVLATAVIVTVVINGIGDEFGNNRGYIWTRSVRAFWDAPVQRKLFGYGMNQFPVFIGAYREEMLQRYQSVFVDAHNELLQMLASTGIVGCIGYFGMFLCCIKKCVKGMKRDGGVVALVGMAVMAAFLVQGITNSQQVFTTPLYFVFLGMFGKWQREDVDKKSDCIF